MEIAMDYLNLLNRQCWSEILKKLPESDLQSLSLSCKAFQEIIRTFPPAAGKKWRFLQHKGPVFAPPYQPLPETVSFWYAGESVRLSPAAEEIAGFYAKLIEHECTEREEFNDNFFERWRESMTEEERELITDLDDCDFSDINDFFKTKSEERKALSAEEKRRLKEEKEALEAEYGLAVIDGQEEKVGNFRVEPPGLFMGRGDHPKMGWVKKRITPEDVIINCSPDSQIPQPPQGSNWKEVRHDPTVTWLACWTDTVLGKPKYVIFAQASRLKGQSDLMKYEEARKLSKRIEQIREGYVEDLKSKEMKIRQRAVAMYFIDRLALRAGNQKGEDESDTVGCCSLRWEHIGLAKEGRKNIVMFDFLGKDSIRYENEVEVEKRIYENLEDFLEDKEEGDALFDRLTTAGLNKHLKELMDGLTAKVFRTYNASHTLQAQLDELTPEEGTVQEKVFAYNRANREVALLCNHQRAVPKNHDKVMKELNRKIKKKEQDIKAAKKELTQLKKEAKKGVKNNQKKVDSKTDKIKKLTEQLKNLEIKRDDKAEGKEVALGTSKLNYLDPRITVAWCKKYDVPIDKIYNKTQRAKFAWAIEETDSEFRFD